MTAPASPARSTGLVIARGAATGLLIAMPAAFVNVVLADQTPKPRAGINVSFLVVLLGFVLAGWSAGREAPVEPAKHGAIAAAVAFVPIEVIAVLGRLDRGDPISLGGIIIVGLLAACVGTVGGRIGARKRTKGEVG